MTQVLQQYAPILSHVPGNVVALGNVYRENTTSETAKKGVLDVLLSLVGLKSKGPTRWQYLALTDTGQVSILDFAGDQLSTHEQGPVSSAQVRNVSSDESWLKLDFDLGGKSHKLKIHRYQLPDLEGGLLMDPAQMQQVGEMTRTLEAAFRQGR